jgi:hypothetical protein
MTHSSLSVTCSSHTCRRDARAVEVPLSLTTAPQARDAPRTRRARNCSPHHALCRPADADDDRADVPIDRATYCTMRSLMTVNRVFSEPALDRLWESATPWRLGVLMPSSMVEIQIAEVRCPIEHYRQVCSTLKHLKIGPMSALLVSLDPRASVYCMLIGIR